MSYIGNTQQNQSYVPAVDFFNGNGSTTAFTLSKPVASVAQIQAVINNVPQKPGDAYTVSGSTITFTSAPPSGTNNIYVYYTSPNTQVVQPGQGTVSTTSIADGAVTPAKLSTGGPYWNTSGYLGIGTSSPGQNLDVYSASAFTSGIRSSGSVGAYAVWSIDGNGPYVILKNSGTETGRITADSSNNLFFCNTASATERMRLDGSGNLLFNSGYGSVATAYGCRAWVNFNASSGTPTIQASGNVSSITDGGVGYFTVNFSSAMPDAKYSAVGGAGQSSGDYSRYVGFNGVQTANGVAIRVAYPPSDNATDGTWVCVSVFR